ncbi:MAG: SDR family oxidoreductase [Candidatus Omnitrophica bacterium]|nr:SDR family oxidoreductase [Candidatus Omnitrophota bacterium]
MNKILSQKIILITGGTSQLGRIYVTKALDEGAKVYFTYFKQKDLAKELSQKGAHGFELNLADTPSLDQFVKSFREKEKSLDVLIHNAAAVRDGMIQNMSEEAWDYVLNVNLKAPFYLSKKLLPLLFQRKSSKIFMLTSRLALKGAPGVANYAASKAGLIAVVKTMAQELGRKKVLVNAVNPGFMKSPMTADAPESVIRQNLQDSSLGQFSNPEEVADFLIYLCSDKMTQVTGQVFHFDSRKI